MQPPPPPPPPPPEDPAEKFRTAEYKQSWALEYINAADAYAAGFTGADVVIGISDFNFNLSSTDVAYHPDSADLDPVAHSIWENQVGTTLSSSPHGQAVAMVAAGAKDGVGTHGVAFDAEVLAVHSNANVNSRIETRNGVTAHISNPWSYMLSRGARVVNLSLGRAVAALDIRQLDNPPEGLTELYLQEDPAYVVEHGGLLVWAVGNEGLANPDDIVKMHYEGMLEAGILESGKGQLIFAGATGQNGAIADFSNHAGFAADHYLVAPAAHVDIYVNGQTLSGNGTSFAAPTIAGAAAVLFEAFPNLSAREVADILFTTATDLGEKGTDPIYGRGLINLEEALKPIGQPQGISRSGGNIAAQGSFLSASPAFGDAFSRATAFESVLTVDSYNRAYRYKLSSSMQHQQPGPSLLKRLDSYSESGFSQLNLAGVGHLGFSFRARGLKDEPLLGRLPDASLAWAGQVEDIQFDFSRMVTSSTEMRLASGQGSDWLLYAPAAAVSLRSLLPSGPNRDAYAALFGEGHGASLISHPNQNLSYGLAASSYRNGESPSLFAGIGENPAKATAVNARVEWTKGGWRAGIGLGLLKEVGSFLGTRSEGALAFADGGQTRYGSLDLSKRFGGGWLLAGRYSMGTSEAILAADSFIESASSVRTTAFSSSLTKEGLFAGLDLVSFSVSQPLRVEAGELVGFFPNGQIATSGKLTYEQSAVSLVPSSRELDMELAYRLFSPGLGLSLQGNALYRVNPNNRQGSETAFLIHANFSF